MKGTRLHALEMVRKIRDQQAEMLAGKSSKEVVAFFRRAGKASLRAASGRRPKKVCLATEFPGTRAQQPAGG